MEIYILEKCSFFRAGKKCNMLLFARRKRSQIKTPNILCKNILRPIYLIMLKHFHLQTVVYI
jgi:uncharacterized protein YcgL (UPF0745 family)